MVAAMLCIPGVVGSKVLVAGANAWLKPMKFFLSSGIFALTMAWLMVYLHEESKVALYSWVVIGVLAFETIYIAIQAGRKQLSHFNVSTPFSGFMYSMMGIAIVIMTLWTGYICFLFFVKPLPELPPAYVWGIRLGLVLFVVFALQGGVMAARMSHTVGGGDGGPGLAVTRWSTRHGDLRIAHFIGMHALQVLPLLAYYVCRSVTGTIITAAVYFAVTSLLFLQALRGRPLIRR